MESKVLETIKRFKKTVVGQPAKLIAKISQLPQNNRIITARLVRSLLISGLLSLFLINIFLPANQKEKDRARFLHQPNNNDYRLNMIAVLINRGEFSRAKNELDQLSPLSLSTSQRTLWQKDYLAWAEQSSPGQEMIITNWQTFLNSYPDYKIGWLYLGFYQLRSGHLDQSQKSYHQAQEIDPGLADIVNQLASF